MNLFRVTAIAMVVGLAASCATSPKTPSERRELNLDASATLQEMRRRDPGLDRILANAAGYVVFPSIGKGGVVVGGAFGRGVLYERGRPAGFVQLNQASIGAQLGGQTFSELIVFEQPSDLQRLKGGTYSLGANVSAIALQAGAAASTTFRDGVAVFVLPRGGLMAELAVGGQRLEFAPSEG